MHSTPFTVGIIQDSPSLDAAAPVAPAEERVREAARRGAQVICLKELFNAPYFCKSQKADRFDLAEPIPGPTTDRMQRVAKELGVVLIVPIFERQAAGVYRNSAVIIDADGAMLGIYRKMHIPDDPLYNEKYYFTPGDIGFRAFNTPFGRVGMLVCWDQWFPEAARLTALRGAQIIFYPTAIGWHPHEKEELGATQYQAWELIQRSHAVANGVYVAASNRVGHEGPPDGGLEFWGGSFVCDPFGTVLRRGDHADEEVII